MQKVFFLRSWEHFDLWTLKAAETSLNQRAVHLSKVSADGRDRSQDTSLPTQSPTKFNWGFHHDKV